MTEFNQPSERTYTTRPPNAEEVLVRVYTQWRITHKYTPEGITSPLDMAYWWISHQEPASGQEGPRPSTDAKGNQFWTVPYIDRLTCNFRKFLALPDVHKAFVVDKIKSGIPWRGDDMDSFLIICAEEEKMKQDKPGYIEAALVALKDFKMGATA